MKNLGKVGVIGRFKPLHNSAYTMLEKICEQADKVIIGIGSSNKYNVRNPFTVKETKDMIDLALTKFSNYEIIQVPDFAHIPEYRDGQKWKEHIVNHFGSLDYFITGNEYVGELLKYDYNILHPGDLIPVREWSRLRGTEVRIRMAMGEDWRLLVPNPVEKYIDENNLVKRFRTEFGLETLTILNSGVSFDCSESIEEEMLHTEEV